MQTALGGYTGAVRARWSFAPCVACNELGGRRPRQGCYDAYVRIASAGLIALTVVVGCVRLGYEAHSAPSGAGSSAPRDDAAITGGRQAPGDAATHGDGGLGDASDQPVMDAARDAAPDDASSAQDGAVQGPMDSGIDSGSTDPGDDAGAEPADGGAIDPCPDRSDALFCDGFEDPAFSRWSYAVVTNGTVTRSTTRVHSGAGSLRATTSLSEEHSFARYGVRVFDHQKSGEVWLRYYYYLPSSSDVDATFSSGLIAEIEPPYFGISLLIRPDGLDLSTGSTFIRSTNVFPRDRWVCVELHVQIDAVAGIAEAYLDGSRLVRSSAMKTLPSNGYTNIDVGVHYTNPGQGPVEVFVDDVAAGDQRVGCN